MSTASALQPDSSRNVTIAKCPAEAAWCSCVWHTHKRARTKTHTHTRARVRGHRHCLSFSGHARVRIRCYRGMPILSLCRRKLARALSPSTKYISARLDHDHALRGANATHPTCAPCSKAVRARESRYVPPLQRLRAWAKRAYGRILGPTPTPRDYRCFAFLVCFVHCFFAADFGYREVRLQRLQTYVTLTRCTWSCQA